MFFIFSRLLLLKQLVCSFTFTLGLSYLFMVNIFHTHCLPSCFMLTEETYTNIFSPELNTLIHLYLLSYSCIRFFFIELLCNVPSVKCVNMYTKELARLLSSAWACEQNRNECVLGVGVGFGCMFYSVYFCRIHILNRLCTLQSTRKLIWWLKMRQNELFSMTLCEKNTETPLHIWMLVVFCQCVNANAISPTQIHKRIICLSAG